MKPRWILNAMQRLRDDAKRMAVYDENGKLLHEGKPQPADVERELRRAYQYGRAEQRKDSR